jgi:hypothetical protein
MKSFKSYCVLVLAASLLAVSGCGPKTTGEKIGDKVDDALDRRPGEAVRDAAEDTGDAISSAAAEVKDSAKEAASEGKAATK